MSAFDVAFGLVSLRASLSSFRLMCCRPREVPRRAAALAADLVIFAALAWAFTGDFA